MARSKIPNPLERRHLIVKELPASQAQQIADAYLEQGRAVEAVDFLRKAEAAEPLAALRRQAIEGGDAFLLRAVGAAQGEPPARDEWRELAAAAEREGKEAYAVEARRQAERGDD